MDRVREDIAAGTFIKTLERNVQSINHRLEVYEQKISNINLKPIIIKRGWEPETEPGSPYNVSFIFVKKDNPDISKIDMFNDTKTLDSVFDKILELMKLASYSPADVTKLQSGKYSIITSAWDQEATIFLNIMIQDGNDIYPLGYYDLKFDPDSYHSHTSAKVKRQIKLLTMISSLEGSYLNVLPNELLFEIFDYLIG